VHLWILGLRYGLTDKFTIGLLPRYYSRKATTSNFITKPQVSGLGDTNLLMKYHLWGRRRTHISLFHLLGIPTGDEDASVWENNKLFKIPLGSGEFSFTPGIAMTMEKEPFMIHANASYRFIDSTKVADEFRCDLAFVFPRFNNFETMLELNYRWVEDHIGQTIDGLTVKEPGGHTLFFSPGFQIYLPKGYKAELGFQWPAIKPPDGAWLENGIFHIGLKKYFF
jgi:hypothetical protein